MTYIYTTHDMTTPFDYQMFMVEIMRAEGQAVDSVELEAGHSPTLTKAKEVVNAIKLVAARLQI